ncbi:DUF5412 domain-containing protein [Aquibacillus koreensis]|uniref:DUF5412 domain-containing protein n=1 Tax=Aquibacillus koreensis TaxID=279446 RepID=A0A9X3WM04_9BACI|nr:DUF5412 domain-containing protein [Aquibacillus koreensis]MCT2534719.1 DUF5412 domain-containing protein [Aquibacillus koreensis]MDC3419671.1 DUF5412 domain-containing protein [Aquibacillus koreensis]
MGKRFTLWSLYLTLFCIVSSAYSLFSMINNNWLISPLTVTIFLMMGVLSLCLAVVGVIKDDGTWWKITRSWLVLILSSLTSFGLLLALLFTTVFSSMGESTHIKTVSSPNNTYTIEFYKWDAGAAGAAGTFGIRGELNGPLWSKKRIYYEKRTENVVVEWENDSEVSINNHILNLDEGETFGY